jgi:hypothetical protein
MPCRCSQIPGRRGVFELTKLGEPRVEWDRNSFVATIDGVQYSLVTSNGRGLSDGERVILEVELPFNYSFGRTPVPELVLQVFSERYMHMYYYEVREMRKTRQH